LFFCIKIEISVGYTHKPIEHNFLVEGRSSSVINSATSHLSEVDNFLKHNDYFQRDYEDPIDDDGKIRKRFILGSDDSYIK